MTMREKLGAIIKYLTDPENTWSGPEAANLIDRVHADGEEAAIAHNLNRSFLISLSGKSHTLYNRAERYLDDLASHPSWKDAVLFYKEGIKHIHAETADLYNNDKSFKEELDALYSWTSTPENCSDQYAGAEKIRKVFFPEGVSICGETRSKIELLREKRRVKVTGLNPCPVSDPAKEILITSNILITVPPLSEDIDTIDVSAGLRQVLKQIIKEEQLYWYDHPVPAGVRPEHNEIIYGLEGLDNAVEFEKQRGVIDRDASVTCVLSVSVTHKGLQGIVKDLLEDELRKEKNIKHLDLYVFTEAETAGLVDDVFSHLDENLSDTEHCLLNEVFGVDGEYGRHYSFLKAVAAFWQVFVDNNIRGTFKIDLDQVFPQKELVEQGGLSAFEHFRTPLWGAEGVDSEGSAVELGMIAGALVDQKDIADSLFTPDVCFPADKAKGDELVFFSRLPQALSTEAEMMTRYNNDELDGIERCIQRIHVTGGTSGILVDSLRRHRPFTPTFIGRAEDQAYILSVLFSGNQNYLRYVHKDGLIMRHDKEAFAAEAIKTAATGKIIGDYIRILMFSYYVKALPWPFGNIKNEIDPFTGCFVSRIPLTVVYLRFALKLASFFADNSKEKNVKGLEFVRMGVKRLNETVRQLTSGPNPLLEQFKREQNGWNLYYELLDRAEEGIKKSVPLAVELQKKARTLVENCRINFGKS
jgi:hypothetical protein